MKIKFNDGWVIENFDSNNIVLRKPDGTLEGYFSSVEGALFELLEQKIRQSDKKTVQKLLDEIKKSKGEILEKLEEVRK